MGFVLLVGIGWALCYVFEGKTAEYRSAQDQHWEKLNKELKTRHPSWDRSRRARALWWGARRNALGHFAYQLRHGWWPAAADMRDGFGAARRQHQEWVNRRIQNGEPVPSLRRAIYFGWQQAKKKFQRSTSKTESAPTDAPTTKPDTTPRETGGTVRRLHPVGGNAAADAIPPNGEVVTDTMTGETTTISAYRTHLEQTATAARQRLEEAQAEMSAADAEIRAHENANQSLLASGLGNDTAGGMSELMEAAIQRKAAAEHRLQSAEQAVAKAEAAKADLRSKGHENVEQAVQGATAKVGDTSFYRG